MKEAIYEYLRSELYPLPSCNDCQYSDPSCKRIPCDLCDYWNKFKLHSGHEADLKKLTRGIITIIKNKYRK